MVATEYLLYGSQTLRENYYFLKIKRKVSLDNVFKKYFGILGCFVPCHFWVFLYRSNEGCLVSVVK